MPPPMNGPGGALEFEIGRGLNSCAVLRDGTRMPVLGLGVWKTPPGNATREAVASALRNGYRSVDTAALYRNEGDVGEAVRSSGIPRDEIFVTTKVWNDDQGYDSTLRAFERSRRTLGLSNVDLYLVHWPVPGKRLDTWRALLQLQREGKVRAVGVSNFTVAHLEELLGQSGVTPVVNQVEFHPFLYQAELLRFCREHRIQLEAYAPLSRGQRLSDATLGSVAAAHHRSPAQIMIRWGLQHEVVEIPKSVRPERIAENGQVFDFELSSEEMVILDRLDTQSRTSWDPSATR
jgi:diketogulonate reductase-like aldo/keto reductase